MSDEATEVRCPCTTQPFNFGEPASDCSACGGRGVCAVGKKDEAVAPFKPWPETKEGQS